MHSLQNLLHFSPQTNIIVSNPKKMKKMLIVSLALGMGILFSSSALAYKEPVREDTGSPSHKISLQQKLNKALEQRWSFFRKDKERNLETKTIPYQQQMHMESRKATNTSEVSTMMKRTGALMDYSKDKPFEDTNYIRPNRTSVFKARAIDYYVDGGDAGKDAMKSNVIVSSEHKIDTNKYYNTVWKRDFEAIGNMRDVQRKFYSPALAKTATQRVSSNRKGDYYRNLMHPFMGQEIEEEFGDNFSTEAE